MSLFFVFASLLVTLVSVTLFLSVRRAARDAVTDIAADITAGIVEAELGAASVGAGADMRDRINVAIFRERRAELDAERDAVRMTAPEHVALVAELERLLVDDVGGEARALAPVKINYTQGRWLPALIILVPLLVFSLYFLSGYNADIRDWLALQTRSASIAALQQPLTNEAAAKAGVSLADAARLTQASLGRRQTDADAWAQLGFTWLGVDDPAIQNDATFLGIESLRTAWRLDPSRIEIALSLARVELMLNKRELDDEIRGLLDAALALEPHNADALMMYGMAAYEAGDYALAQSRWVQLRDLLGPGSPNAALVGQAIAKAESAQRAAQGSRIAVHVQAATGVDIPQDAVLFVILRAQDGPPMPIAVKRLPAKVPVDIALSDADQMVKGESLAKRGPLVLLARLSRNGSPMPSPGDVESEPVHVVFPVGAPITLTLSRRVD